MRPRSKYVMPVITLMLVSTATSATIGFYADNQRPEFSEEETHSIGVISGIDKGVNVSFAVKTSGVTVQGLENVTVGKEDFDKSYYTGEEYVDAKEFSFTSYPESPESEFTVVVSAEPVEEVEGVQGSLSFQRAIEFGYEGGRGFESDPDEEEDEPVIVFGEEDEENSSAAEYQPDIEDTNVSETNQEEEGRINPVLVLTAVASMALLIKVIL